MATINGTAGNDVIVGTTVDDVITGAEGNDRLNGGAGNDSIFGGPGTDTLTGDAGNDLLYGGDGNDGFFGGGGDDTAYGEAGNDVMFGDGGSDVMYGGDGDDQLDGGAGNDILYGNAGNDTLAGGTGDDQLYGGPGVNVVTGGAGNDTFVLALTSANLTAEVRADLGMLKTWMADQAAAAGTLAALSAQTTGPALTLTSLGITVSLLETVRVTLDGVEKPIDYFLNAAPAGAATVSASTLEDTALAGQIAVVDPDGDALSFATFRAPSHGSLTLNPVSGEYTYSPAADFAGQDSFTVRAVDAAGLSVTQTVMVGVMAVNDAPVTAASATLATAEDTAVAGQVLATDVEGNALAFIVEQGPGNGTVTLDQTTGTYSYAPNANFAGTDVFKVQVGDGNGGVASQTVTVDVAAVADSPLLQTVSQTVSLSGGIMLGSKAGDTLIGASGISHILGGAGNDTIRAGSLDTVTTELGIAAALQDLDGSESLSVAISGMPAGASLSAGVMQADGSWLLAAGDLAGLAITAPTAVDFTLNVIATTTEANGTQASASQTLTIAFDRSQAASLVEGGSGSDTIVGSDKGDVIFGGSKPHGTPSLPSVATEADNDVLRGGDGNDTIYGQKGNDQLFGDAGDDWLSGGKGNDVLHGGSGANTIYGNSGNDVIFAEGGDDTIDGGSGFDTLDFSASVRAMTFDVSTHTAIGYNTATFKGIEKIVGSDFADVYKGSSGADMFAGGAGDDQIRGLGGADTLAGGAGNDTFVFMQKDGGALDHITDFSVGDKIDLHDYLKSLKYNSINSVFHVSNGGDGVTLSVKFGNSFVDVVQLDGVHGLNANDMLAQGMILT